MGRKDAQADSDPQQAALLSLFRQIVSGDRSAALQQLSQSPSFAQLALAVGASRQTENSYFFTEIMHYAYAGDTALHIAAAAHQVAIATELISQGANVRSRNRRGAEPLHYAADDGPGSQNWDLQAQAAIVTLLIKAGADPNVDDKSGVAPLHRAVRNRCTGTVRALLDHGADPLRKNKSGSTPLHLATQTTGHSGSGSAESHVEQAVIIRLLLDHGARPTDKNTHGKSVSDGVKSDWIRDLLK